MKTIIHYYEFDTKDGKQALEYNKLFNKLKAMGLKCLESIGVNCFEFYSKEIKPLDGQEIELETKQIFDNQWNTTKGLRVFDWSEPILDNRYYKIGMWLEQTEEMDVIRRNAYQCGYCGKVSDVSDVYCRKCLDNEHLTGDYLPLLLLVPAKDRWSAKRPDVIPEWLISAWKDAQDLGKISREEEHKSINRQRVAALVPEAEKKAAQLIADAKIEAKGKTWLLDRGLNILDNVIFYTHTQKFGFGWRTSMKDNPPDLTDFPFPYEMK